MAIIIVPSVSMADVRPANQASKSFPFVTPKVRAVDSKLDCRGWCQNGCK